ncbi:hypothetical protein D3C72_1941550 [compost metagenome]
MRLRTAIWSTFSSFERSGISLTLSQNTDSRSAGRSPATRMMRRMFSMPGSSRDSGGVTSSGVLFWPSPASIQVWTT